MRPIIAAVSLVLALILSEQFVRWFHPAPTVFRFLLGGRESAYELSSNPILGYTLKANFRADNPDCHDTFDYTNSFGQRDIERPLERTEKHRIIMLGDSVVAGHGICGVNDTLSRKLEQLYMPAKIEVLNFGVGGYCTRAEVELLKTKGLKFKPDLALLVFVNNDYVNSNGAIVNQIRSARPRTIEWAFRKSHIFRWGGLQFNLFGLADDFDPGSRLSENSSAIGDNNVEEGIRLLAELAAQHNFEAAVLLWPYFTDWNIHEPWPLDEENRGGPLPVEILAERYGIQSYRISEYFKNDFANTASQERKSKYRRTPRWTYTIGDGIHPSERGAEAGAKAIIAVLNASNPAQFFPAPAELQ